ncbi:MAG: BrnT family toxin [Nitrospinae bacterium]|nr:BrnT family toxin [Nitrospinota bacterium]
MAIRKPSFEWDERKNIENQRKHGVSFVLAQNAFFDPNRVVARDLKHSSIEERFYLMGRAGGGVMTVRFTLREGIIRILGAGYWRKGKVVYEKTNGKKTD